MARRMSVDTWQNLQMSLKEKVTNEEVLEKTKVSKRLYQVIQTKKQKYFCQIIHQIGGTLQRAAQTGKVNGCGGRGRPKTISPLGLD